MDTRLHVRIVPMNADHLDEVAELERICFSTPWSRNMLAEELDNMLSAFLVALDDADRVVGYAGVQVILDEGYITNIAVRPECRRQGVAAKLLQVFLDFAKANKLSFLTLEVRASNYDAITLYGSRGFRSVGRRKNYYEHPREDALIMTREFAGRNEANTDDDIVFYCINAYWESLIMRLPVLSDGKVWKVKVNTKITNKS